MNLTDEEYGLLVDGLNMRRNFIETGNPILSAADLERRSRINNKILSIDQMRLVVTISDLADKINKVRYEKR